MVLATVLLLLVAPSGGEGAAPTIRTGQWLLHLCENYKDGTNADDVSCHYYVAGFIDALTEYEDVKRLWTQLSKQQRVPAAFTQARVATERDAPGQSLSEPVACLPEGATYEQTIRVIVKYLRDHPERLHKRREWLVIESLRTAFPCAK